jgi:hypothetical protein
MRGETSTKVGAFGLEDHHQAAADKIDIHMKDAGLTQAGENLGPHHAMMLSIRLDGCRIVLEVDGQHGARYHPCPGALFHTSPPESKQFCEVYVYFSVKVVSSVTRIGVGSPPVRRPI